MARTYALALALVIGAGLCLATALAPQAGRAESPLMDQASRAFQDGDYLATVDGVTAAFRAGEISQQMSATALVFRGMAYARLGDAEAAWNDIDNAIETSPTEAFASLGAADVALTLGEPVRGLAYANATLRYHPNEARAREIRAALLRALGDEELAERDSERARTLRADDDLQSFEEGYARASCVIGNDRACAEALASLMPDRAGPGTVALLGYMVVDRGEEALGREMLEWAEAWDNEAVETWLYVGLLAYRDGDNKTARAAFLEAVRRDPLDLRAGLGLIAATPGDRFAALEQWRTLTDGHPHEPTYGNLMSLAETSDWPAAADRGEELRQTYDGPFVAVAVALLAGEHLPADRIKALFGKAVTFQRMGFDDFTRRLADIERRRLAAS